MKSLEDAIPELRGKIAEQIKNNYFSWTQRVIEVASQTTTTKSREVKPSSAYLEHLPLES